MLKTEDLLKILAGNYEYVQEYGYEGMEPHILADLYFTKKADLKSNFINKVFRKLEVKIIQYFPFLLKPYLKLLGINYKQITPYAFGYFMQAYVNFYKITNDENILDEIEKLNMILTDNMIETKSGLGIPYSKNNKGGVLGSIVTNAETVNAPGGVECFWGFILASKLDVNQKYMENANLLASAFYNDFCIKACSKGLCFDYSNQNDGTHILNASILIATCVLESGLDRANNNKIVKECYEYVKQYMIGYDELPYAGIEDEFTNKSWYSYDCYHSGFVYRSMYFINSELLNGIDNVFIMNKVRKMMCDFLFDNKVVMVKGSHYFDIHAFAEYINTYSCFYKFFSDDERSKIEDIIENSFGLFTSKKDSRRYIYRKVSYFTIDEYMPLWGQGAMMNAISNLILAKKSHSIVD